MNQVDPELLKILCCPESHQPLAEADDAFLAEINRRVMAGELKNRAGKPVPHPLDGGLLRQDRQILYPIRQRIPILLIEEGIPL